MESKNSKYKAAIERREWEERRELCSKFRRAWATANRASKLMKTQFGVKKVAVIGSLTDDRLFHHRSDVDLVVWGLAENLYFPAVARLLDLDTEHRIDLVRIEDTGDFFKKTIEQEGVFI